MLTQEQLLQIIVIVLLVIVILYLSCKSAKYKTRKITNKAPDNKMITCRRNERFAETDAVNDDNTETDDEEDDDDENTEEFATCTPIVTNNGIEGFLCDENFAIISRSATKSGGKKQILSKTKKPALKKVVQTKTGATPVKVVAAKTPGSKSPSFKVTGESLQLVDGSGLIVDKVCFGSLNNCIDSAIIKSINITTSLANDPLYYQMYSSKPTDSVIFQNIFDAWDSNIIQKIGDTPVDEATYRSKLWNGLPILSIGGNDEPNNRGVAVKVPANMSVLWVRVLNDRWLCVRAADITDPGRVIELGQFASGYRKLNKISPDGGPSDGMWNLHAWMPIPLRNVGPRIIQLTPKLNTNDGSWISGLAFSTNPWNHATNSAVAYHWGVNGAQPVTWNTNDWNNDQLAMFNAGGKWSVMVPIVPSSKDKLLYIIEHNSNWDSAGVTSVSINGQPVERFKTTYDNPFSRHHNSKIYQKYIACRIPSSIIDPNYLFVRLTVDMSRQNNNLNFREIGTHDL